MANLIVASEQFGQSYGLGQTRNQFQAHWLQSQGPMYFDRLMWLCAALFVLFGLPLAFIEDIAWQHVSGGLSILSLSLFALAMVGNGLVKGKIRLQFSWINRTTQPRTFWASIALVFSTGMGVMIAAIWVLFFKTW